jgi:hypothetical protein
VKRTVIWTALPKERLGATKLRVSVHVAPRLEAPPGGGKLSGAEEFLNWPEAVSNIDFGISFGNGPEIAATPATDPAPRSDLWKSLFSSDTFVRGRVIDNLDGKNIVSYPVKAVLDFLQKTYTEIGLASPQDHPAFQLLADKLSGVSFVDDQDRLKKIEGQINQELASNRAINFDDGDPELTGKTFFALDRFHHRPKMPHVSPVPPDVDFHQMLAAAGAHPRLLRMLGIVIDLDVEMRDLQQLPPVTDVKVVVHRRGEVDLDLKDVTPRLRCFTGTVFIAAERAVDPELAHGHLPLGSDAFHVAQIDPDGGGLKTKMLADNLKISRRPKHLTEDTPDAYSLPSLRSGGISVARVNRAPRFVFSLGKGTAANTGIVAAAGGGSDPMLAAEDVTRAYYVDVWDDVSNQWHSLGRRVGNINFTALGAAGLIPVTADVNDEASISSPPTGPADPAAPDKKNLYLQESLFNWRGWSLAAAQPGKHIQQDDSLDPPVDKYPPPFPIKFDYHAAPGSLPRLRFGVNYRIRMRAADIAGNAVPFDLAAGHDDSTLTQGVHFERYEPVGSPIVMPRKPRREGSSSDRVVIRSNFDPAPPGAADSGQGDRYVAPPKTAQRTAEAHGLFDTPKTSTTPSVVDKTAYKLIVDRESGSFDSIGTPDPSDPNGTSHDHPGVYIDADPSKPIVLPYLPDPFSRGAAFLGLPGTVDVFAQSFDPEIPQKWPDYRPFRLNVVQAAANAGRGPAAPPKFDPVSRTLTVELGKGDVVPVRLSSIIGPEDLDKLGVWQWLKGTLAAADALAGKLWMLTPFRMLTLVHAVRQPLATPEFTALSAVREIGQTFAKLTDTMAWSRKSTSHIDVFANWTDPIDDGPHTPDPFERTVDAFAFQVPANRESGPDTLGFFIDHEQHDTKHRSIEYRATATTRFGEYFIERERVELHGFPQTVVLDPAGLVSGSVHVTDAATGKPYAEGIDYTVQLDAGALVFPAVVPPPPAHPPPPPVIAPNAKVNVSYLALPITRDSVKTAIVDVRSSARPAAPKVLYVVPTFTWSGAPGSSTRTGTGLRVYLDRPWYSTGAEERLGVVLWPGSGPADPPPELVPYVTGWGLDPLFASPATKSKHPTVVSFPLSDKHGFSLTLDELPAAVVNVAGHAIDLVENFDAERKLWFCDIDVDSGAAYAPFVRLALARYQPHSVAGVELSRVVLADFAQLTPDRTASVVFQAGRGNPNLTVTLSGRSYDKTVEKPGPGVAQVTIEQRNPKISGDLAWEPVGNPVPMPGLFNNQGLAVWSAKLTLPSALAANKFRLVLEQFEEVPDRPNFSLGNKVPTTSLKLVFTDILPLGTPS